MANSPFNILILEHLNTKHVLSDISKYFRRYLESLMDSISQLPHERYSFIYGKYAAIGRIVLKLDSIDPEGNYVISFIKIAEYDETINTSMILEVLRLILSEYGTIPHTGLDPNSDFVLHGKFEIPHRKPTTNVGSVPSTLQSK